MERRIVQRVADGELAPARAVELLERSAWEEPLERLEAELAEVPLEKRVVLPELQVVIAQQLRELIFAIRPLLKHPLLRRY